MSSSAGSHITSVLKESRTFKPAPAFSAAAHVKSLAEYEALWKRAASDPEGFWADQANSLEWIKRWDKVLVWNEPHARWFDGGKINASANCLDRHLAGPRRNKAALIWEGEPGDGRVLTYQMLHREVCKFANVLKGQGIKPGDRVTIYMPMIPEAAIAMLACARIGATHSVIFGGFSADAVADRNNDAKARLVITADGGWRRGKVVPLKQNVDEALVKSPTVEKCIVFNRCDQQVEMKAGRDLWWHELMATASAECPPEPLDSEHPLYILYTSGSTGKPKGVLHSTAGYLLGVSYTHRLVFDLKEEDVYWCTADVGWVTGHSYIVYGPLCNGATTVMYEGAPNHPREDRFWEIVEKYRVNTFYTAPTAIRAFVKWGDQWPAKHDLSSLRLLGSVGEPINPEAWMWYHSVIGGGRCPIVDTWWQTETGMIMIAPLPGATPTKPGSATRPLPGVLAEVVDKKGNPVGEPGRLAGDQQAVAGDAADDLRRRRALPAAVLESIAARLFHSRRRPPRRRWLLLDHGSGRRRPQRRRPPAEHDGDRKRRTGPPPPRLPRPLSVGTARRSEGRSHRLLRDAGKTGEEPTDVLKRNCASTSSRRSLATLARPDEIRFTETLPKTRSGKIMRRLLRDIAAGKQTTGDVTTLEDFAVLAKLREDDE